MAKRSKVKVPTEARGGRLAEAGYVRLRGPERHYRAPDGREVSYRAAFKAARGETLEDAVRQPSKFANELNTARRTRELARNGELVARVGVSAADERAIAGATLRHLTKGHYSSEGTKAGKRGTLKVDTAYARILRTLHEEPAIEARENETEGSIEKRLDAERKRINAPNGKKARLLVALGYRDAGADYDVGETP